jgi:dTDP-glucose 4,6-dehydratase
MKRVIVTGGCGFIGSNLIRYLLKKNYFVINIDKLSYSANLYNLKGINKKNYFFVKTDIGNKNKIISILNKFKPKIVFNLAAETHVDRSIDSPLPFINNNFLSVFKLLEAIKFHNKKNSIKTKLLHVSTDEVYGDIINKSKRSDENHPYRPSSPYAASKASSDLLIKSYIRTYKFPAIISNCSNNYGPRQFPEKIIPKLIFNIINNKPLPIYGNGLNSREWIHVEDHCRALEILSLKGKVGNTYNIGSGEDFSNIEITNLLIKIMKKKMLKNDQDIKIKFVKDRPGHDFRYALNSKKMYKEFKWLAKIKINNGLSKTVDWYLDNLKYFETISKKEHINRIGLKI